MLAATEPQTTGDPATEGYGSPMADSPIRARRLRLIWLPVPNYTPQQPLRGKERWGKPESGRALMLAATEPQVIQQRRERVTNGGRSPVRTQDSKVETDLVASAT